VERDGDAPASGDASATTSIIVIVATTMRTGIRVICCPHDLQSDTVETPVYGL
jgi:hypothetical protein